MIIYNFIKYLIQYLKTKHILDKIYKEENIIYNLSETYKIQFKKDWVGRLYAVINPIVDIDENDRIFENVEDGYSLHSFVDKWVIERMTIASDFIMNKSLFELVTYHIELLDENYNFLFTIEPIAWFDFIKWLKRFLILFGILLIIGIITIIIL